jgi:saccharopine dehydrogenase-like NADP-dependent oxidoreductase
MKAVVLGAGRVGAPMAVDLLSENQFEVAVADRDPVVLESLTKQHSGLQAIREDLSDPEKLAAVLEPFDLVINAVPGFIGYATARTIIEAGKNSVCIAFYEEDPFSLDPVAKDNGVTMIMDCGIYPGMGSALIMEAALQLDEVHSVLTYVGGLPKIREWPSEYKAVFSPIDVIEEYTRPARFVENGCEVTRPALSDAEYISFPKVGTLEAFNTDGLRTLRRTIDAPNMKEKTLRYPGHAEKMKMLRELGFFSREKSIEVDGKQVSPLELTSQVLFPNWIMKPEDRDFTVFQSIIEGMKDGRRLKRTIDMYDEFCPKTGVTSMARTTGYTATLAARMVANGLYTRKGISPPEFMGRCPACMEFMRKGLEARGIEYTVTVEG